MYPESGALLVPEMAPLGEGWAADDDRKVLACAWRERVPNAGFDGMGFDRMTLIGRIDALVSAMKQLHARVHTTTMMGEIGE
jgi:hypothetical protein